MKKTSLIFKFILTGLIYAVITCIVQVPLANLLYSLLGIEPDNGIKDEMVLLLILTIFIVGIALAVFYYLCGHLFHSNKRWLQGIKFASFIYLTNYIPQVFFLDATNGAGTLIKGGFPVIQVELFDFVILFITVLIMVCYLPCKYTPAADTEKKHFVHNLVSGILFAGLLIAINELLLPLIGFESMADGLNVAAENRLFFYLVMAAGFFITGAAVSFYSVKVAALYGKKSFIPLYGILVWSIFDLTMLPLGYGIIPTILFIAASMISFSAVYLVKIWK